jgi:glycosyltransferase involved in cell wall biosynthesis
MLNAHIYVMPSHIENSPNNLCEAMILGMPCIATFAGGTGSILQDGVDGILVQDGDPWAMAGAIIELINSPERLVFYAKNARTKALKRHDISNTVNQYLTIYTKILEDWKQ